MGGGLLAFGGPVGGVWGDREVGEGDGEAPFLVARERRACLPAIFRCSISNYSSCEGRWKMKEIDDRW